MLARFRSGRKLRTKNFHRNAFHEDFYVKVACFCAEVCFGVSCWLDLRLPAQSARNLGVMPGLRVGNAQVAEWLMAADCKSAALRSYGGSNPPLCTTIFQNRERDLKMEKRKRFYVALAVYAVLALLAWMTMSSEPISSGNGWLNNWVSMRALTIAILAVFAFRTALHWKAGQIREQDDEEEQV